MSEERKVQDLGPEHRGMEIEILRRWIIGRLLNVTRPGIRSSYVLRVETSRSEIHEKILNVVVSGTDTVRLRPWTD